MRKSLNKRRPMTTLERIIVVQDTRTTKSIRDEDLIDMKVSIMQGKLIHQTN